MHDGFKMVSRHTHIPYSTTIFSNYFVIASEVDFFSPFFWPGAAYTRSINSADIFIYGVSKFGIPEYASGNFLYIINSKRERESVNAAVIFISNFV